MAEGTTGSTPSGQGAGNAQQTQGQGMPTAQGSQKTAGNKPGTSREPTGNPLTQAAGEVESDFGESSLGDEIEGEGRENEYDDGLDGEMDDEGNPKEKKEEKPDPFSDQAKHKIKIKGQDVEVTGTQLKKLAEQGGRMYQAMEEAAQYRKQNDEFRGLFDRVRTNPESGIEFLEALGHNFDDLAHKHVLKKMNYASMSDIERKAYDYEQELNKYRKQDEESKKQREEQAKQQRTQQAVQSVKQEVFEHFSQKFDSQAMQLPKNQKVLADTLEIVLGSWNDSTGQYMPIAKAFDIVQNRRKADKLLDLNDLSDDELNSLPDDHPLIKRIRQREIQRHKSRQSGRPERTSQNQQFQRASQPKTQKNISIDDAFAQLEKRFT